MTRYLELFKAQVAARIGREPHEILLKRQGERPFKDQLTLQVNAQVMKMHLDFANVFAGLRCLERCTDRLVSLDLSLQAISFDAHWIKEPILTA
jgi:hypothetical protein